MGDDYLWDRKGEPDPEVVRLEQALAPLRYAERPVPVAGEGHGHAHAPDRSPPRGATVLRLVRSRWTRGALVAAAIAAGALLVVRRPPVDRPVEARRLAPLVPTLAPAPPPPEPTGPAFAVTRVAGAPRIGDTPIEATGKLHVGQWLSTDAGSRAVLEVATIGRIEVAESTRLRLTATGPEQHRLDLERGFLSARVIAPPRVFIVGTPAATAVDLGCAYTLSVDDRGAGALRVTWGWVALEEGTRASFVPAGASCTTRPGQGPGTPAFDDAPPALREALRRFDFEEGGEAAARAALAGARRRDALSVWHLLSRVDEALREDVYRRLAALAPPPRGVTRAAALKLDPAALEAWRDSVLDKVWPAAPAAPSAITW